MNQEFQKAKQLLSTTLAKAPGFDCGCDFGFMYGSSMYMAKLNKAKLHLKELADKYNLEETRQLLKELQS